MATASKSSPDYDPIEEALDIGYKVGRTERVKSHEKRVQSARRGGERRGRAEATRTITETRSRLAQRERRLRAQRQARRESEIASARRGAYRAGTADARREAARLTRSAAPERPARSSTPAAPAPSLRAPDFNVPVIGGGLDRAKAARLIVILTVVSAIGVVAHDAATSKTVGATYMTTKDGHTIRVPNHLRTLGGVIIVGVLALIVAEFSPGLGVAMALILAFDILATTVFNRGGLASRLGGGVLSNTPGGDLAIKGQVGGLSKPGAPVYRLANGSLWSPDPATNTRLQGLPAGKP